MNQYGMPFVQTSTLTPSMHPKLTEHGKLCMRNNQLPTKTLVELKDNSIVYWISYKAHFREVGPTSDRDLMTVQNIITTHVLL